MQWGALFYPDAVLVAARASEVGEDRFTMQYQVWSKRTGEIVAEGTGVVVYHDYPAGAKTPLPVPVRSGVAALEA